MSGLAGVAHFDGRPVDPNAFEAMVRATAHRGPDGVERWVDGSTALAHLAHHTLASRRIGAQPLVAPDRAVVVTFDGRIDDRDGLRAALGGSVSGPSDAELALAAFLRWDVDGFSRIVGDFAAVAWDGRRRRVVAARDAMGHRPLHYHSTATSIRWASEVAGVLADRAVPRRPDPGALAERLAGQIRTVESTVWADVRRVPPAHVLVADASGTRIHAGWRWIVQRPQTELSDPDAIHAVRAALTTAVADRLHAADPVTLQLSGGLDSSTVVGLAAELTRAQGSAAPRLASLVFPGRPSDEGPFIDAVCEHTGLATNRVEPAALGWAHFAAESERTLVLPSKPTQAMHLPLLEDARAAGSTVLLTGHGGDEWFTGSAVALADDLRYLRVRGLTARVRQDRALWRTPSVSRHLLRYGLVPLLPPVLQRRAIVRRGLRSHVAPWLRPEFRRAVELDDRLCQPTLGGPVRAEADVAQQLDDGDRLEVIEQAERAAAANGLDLRSPFNDRRVVELGLSLPDRFHRRHGGTRWGVRLAMAGTVPDVVRRRGGKAGFRHVVVDELASRPDGSEGYPHLAGLGWVDEGALLTAEREVIANHRAGVVDHRMWQIWGARAIELWFGLDSGHAP